MPRFFRGITRNPTNLLLPLAILLGAAALSPISAWIQTIVAVPILLFALYLGIVLWVAAATVMCHGIVRMMRWVVQFFVAFIQVFIYPMLGVEDEENNAARRIP